MKIVSNYLGTALVFDSVEDVLELLDNLDKLKTNIDDYDMDSPYVYMLTKEYTDEVDKYTDELKSQFS